MGVCMCMVQQLSVKQGRAGVVSKLNQSRVGVTSIGKKMVKGVKGVSNRFVKRSNQRVSALGGAGDDAYGTLSARLFFLYHV